MRIHTYMYAPCILLYRLMQQRPWAQCMSLRSLALMIPFMPLQALCYTFMPCHCPYAPAARAPERVAGSVPLAVPGQGRGRSARG